MAMATVLLILVVVLVLAALVFGIVSLLSGDDPGLGVVEPDGRAVALPNNRSLTETDLKSVRFDVGWRGYRMAQVDRVLRRTAYDIGYKDEMIAVLEAEVLALREGRAEDADLLQKARESAANPSPTTSTGDSVIDLDDAFSRTSSRDDRLDDTMAALPEFTDSRSKPATTTVDVRRASSDRADLGDAEPGEPGVGASASVDSASGGSGSGGSGSGGEEEARLEAARQEASTPGRIAGRAPHSARYGKRNARAAGKAANGAAKPAEAAADETLAEPGGSTANGDPGSPVQDCAPDPVAPDALAPESFAQESVARDSVAQESTVQDSVAQQSGGRQSGAQELTDPPADRSASA